MKPSGPERRMRVFELGVKVRGLGRDATAAAAGVEEIDPSEGGELGDDDDEAEDVDGDVEEAEPNHDPILLPIDIDAFPPLVIVVDVDDLPSPKRTFLSSSAEIRVGERSTRSSFEGRSVGSGRNEVSHVRGNVGEAWMRVIGGRSGRGSLGLRGGESVLRSWM